MTRQEALLRKALREAGRSYETIEIDHPNGRSWVDGVPTEVVHPRSFFDATAPLVEQPRTQRFGFSGYSEPGRGRYEMLQSWVCRDDTWVEFSARGRDPKTKDVYDPAYYERLADFEFGLVPHHTDWVGPWDTLWTYRFIDCCMVGTIPVLFRSTPLSPTFVDGFRYVWDDTADPVRSVEDAIWNRRLAEDKWQLP